MRAALLSLCLLASVASAQWQMPAKQVRVSANNLQSVPVTKTNVQLVIDWIDDNWLTTASDLLVDTTGWTIIGPLASTSLTVQAALDDVDDEFARLYANTNTNLPSRTTSVLGFSSWITDIDSEFTEVQFADGLVASNAAYAVGYVATNLLTNAVMVRMQTPYAPSMDSGVQLIPGTLTWTAITNLSVSEAGGQYEVIGKEGFRTLRTGEFLFGADISLWATNTGAVLAHTVRAQIYENDASIGNVGQGSVSSNQGAWVAGTFTHEITNPTNIYRLYVAEVGDGTQPAPVIFGRLWGIYLRPTKVGEPQ